MTKRVQEQPGEEGNAVGPANPAQAQPVDEHGGAGMVNAAKAPHGKGLEAGFSGAVVGTAMTYLSSFIKDPETKKNFLLAIPTVSVAAAAGAHRVLRWYQKRANDKQLTAALAANEETVLRQMADPLLSEKFKQEAQMEYEFTKGQARRSNMESVRMLLEAKKHLTNEGAG